MDTATRTAVIDGALRELHDYYVLPELAAKMWQAAIRERQQRHETTRGGAHPSGSRRINDHFYIQVPWARSINYITKTDWEGVGVEPDVKVPAARALPTALLMALEKRASRVTDPDLIELLKQSIESVKKELGP